jgi:hypothetical protein
MVHPIKKLLPTKKLAFYVFLLGLSVGLLVTLFKTHLLKEGLAAPTAKPTAPAKPTPTAPVKPTPMAPAKSTPMAPAKPTSMAAAKPTSMAPAKPTAAITANNNKAAALMQQQYKLLSPKDIADKGLNKAQLRELKNMPKYVGQAVKIANKYNIDVTTVDPTKTVLPKALQNIMKKIYSVSY